MSVMAARSVATAHWQDDESARPSGPWPIELRDALESDAAAIHALIAGHLIEGRLLPRAESEVLRHVRRFVVATGDDRIVACAELAPLSPRVAEIRSLVVMEEARNFGVGHALVDDLIERAAAAGFERVCAFTHVPAFFVRIDFSLVPHAWLPEKIVTDCRGCDQFRKCGQYAVMRSLGRRRRAP